MSEKNRWIFFLLLLVTAVDLFFAQTNNPNRIFSKAMLMPLLAFAYVRGQSNNTHFARLILTALFFSWLGDIFLELSSRESFYFLIGICCFLTTHILYIVYFLGIKSNRMSYLKKRPVMLLVILALIIELLYILWPNLGALRLPVVAYAMTIGTMLATAAWQYEKIPLKPALLFVCGAFLFVLSDSALAINRFHRPFEGGGIFVMISYVAAQILIILGSIAHLNETSRPLSDQ